MSIVPLKRVTLFGLAAEKARVLDDLQTLGVMHVIGLRAQPRAPLEAQQHYPDAKSALRYLLSCPKKRSPLRRDERFDVQTFVGRVVQNKNRSRQAADRRAALAARIEQLAPWGDFTLPPEGALGPYRLWFYVVPHYKMPRVRQSGLVWHVAHRDPRYAYVVVVGPDEPSADAMPVPRTHTGSVSLQGLEHQHEQAVVDCEDLEAERESLTRWRFLLAQNLCLEENRKHRHEAAQKTLDNDEMFVVQGWVAETSVERLESYADDRALAVCVEPVSPDDRPPTLLENSEMLAGGQEVVAFYQTPGYRAWDPSVAVFFSFALFFAMILADAGYALVIGTIVACFWKRWGRNVTSRRIRNLAALTAVMSLSYGVVIGSYFGMAPQAQSVWGALRLLDIRDFPTMMRISVGVGVAHLVFALLVAVWKQRRSPAALGHAGWIAVLVGGFLYWIFRDAPQGAAIDPLWTLGSLGVGLTAVFFFSSARSIKSPRDAGHRLFDGLKALARLSQAFGDVLSYLRLFALGLASASLSVVFNDHIIGLSEHARGLDVLYCLLIAGFGHALNFTLAIVSGVVHGLRLNLIEFSNWGIAEEGRPFCAFAKKEVFPWTT